MTWRIIRYLQHQFHIRHRKGHGIHSPYLFGFIHETVFNASRTAVSGEITRVHRELRRDRRYIPSGSFGAGSFGAGPVTGRPAERRVSSFVRHSSVSGKYGALLFRIARWFRPEMIIELGTGLGVSTIYLSAGHPGAPLHTIEGNAERAGFAAVLIKRCSLSNVKIHTGDMEGELERILAGPEGGTGQPDPGVEGEEPGRGIRLLAFVDGNHRYGPTIAYVKRLVAAAGEEAVIVMDDIYWSKGMSAAWKEVVSWPGVRVSIDLFHAGILLLRRDLNKEHVKIKF
jgi:hypothetical protein